MLDSGVNEVKAGEELVALTVKRRERELYNLELAGSKGNYSYSSPRVTPKSLASMACWVCWKKCVFEKWMECLWNKWKTSVFEKRMEDTF